jgi:thymidylate synthase (FAD)
LNVKLIRASYEVRTPLDGIMQVVEAAGRCCYKSEAKIGQETAAPFCKMLIDRGHESVIEHASLTVKFTIDRGVSHELVRHRLCSFSQESTRYCDYAPGGKVGGITFVIPPWVNIEEGEYAGGRYTGNNRIGFAECQWFSCMANAEAWYNHLREANWRPEQARAVLPNSLKTEIIVTANLREWRHIFRLRTAPAAHPQMREVMVPLRDELAAALPEVFGYTNLKASTCG